MTNTFGSRLVELRKRQGLTQEALAKKLNVSPQAVSKWEKDVSYPDVTILTELAKILGTSVDFMLGQAQTPVVNVSPKDSKDINKLVFRIKILSNDGDKVKVNLPYPLVKVMIETGMNPKVDGKDVLKDIDIKQILALVEQGVIGKIVEIESKDGDFVEIVVE